MSPEKSFFYGSLKKNLTSADVKASTESIKRTVEHELKSKNDYITDTSTSDKLTSSESIILNIGLSLPGHITRFDGYIQVEITKDDTFAYFQKRLEIDAQATAIQLKHLSEGNYYACGKPGLFELPEEESRIIEKSAYQNDPYFDNNGFLIAIDMPIRGKNYARLFGPVELMKYIIASDEQSAKLTIDTSVSGWYDTNPVW